MCRFERRGVLVYCLVGLTLLTGSLGCCCVRDHGISHNSHVCNTSKTIRNVVTSVEKKGNVTQLRTLSDRQITAYEMSDSPVEIINRIIIEEEDKKADKCKCKRTKSVAAIPLKIFIDEKRNDELGQLSIVKGLPTELVAVSDDLVLELKPEYQKKADMSLRAINIAENNRRMMLTGKECGDIIITNRRGDIVRVKIVPLKILEIGEAEIDTTKPFAINKCRETSVIIVSDSTPYQTKKDERLGKNGFVSEITKDALNKNRWIFSIRSKEFAKVDEEYPITFRNGCNGEVTLSVRVE